MKISLLLIGLDTKRWTALLLNKTIDENKFVIDLYFIQFLKMRCLDYMIKQTLIHISIFALENAEQQAFQN